MFTRASLHSWFFGGAEVELAEEDEDVPMHETRGQAFEAYVQLLRDKHLPTVVAQEDRLRTTLVPYQGHFVVRERPPSWLSFPSQSFYRSEVPHYRPDEDTFWDVTERVPFEPAMLRPDSQRVVAEYHDRQTTCKRLTEELRSLIDKHECYFQKTEWYRARSLQPDARLVVPNDLAHIIGPGPAGAGATRVASKCPVPGSVRPAECRASSGSRRRAGW